MYLTIIRVGNHTEVYQFFDDMLKAFERDDLVKLWSLAQERQLQDIIKIQMTWRLYDTCGVHHVSTDKGHDIFVLVEKDYPMTRGLMTVMLAKKLQVDQSSEMANELLMKIFIQAERPRQ
ncbi:hypothetical protein Tco_0211136 [Tanacetum coccineum]